jgi:hypothetical protein
VTGGRKFWYLDAIDTRGGLAIATQRDRDLTRSRLVEAGPSVFVAPPAFVPEYIESRGTAFGLSRGHAQLGVFIGDEEVPFDSLAAVAEFVRRAYLRGAGGDGAGENGGPRPPTPPPEGGEPSDGLIPMHPSGEHDLAVSLIGAGTVNKALSAKLEVGYADKGTAIFIERSDKIESAENHRRLARGALRTLHELVRRRPSGQANKLNWFISFEKLLGFMMRMGLWPLLSAEVQGGDLFTWLFGDKHARQTPYDDNIREDFNMYSHWARFWGGAHWAWQMSTDAFDELAYFPVPPGALPLARPDANNLQALLTVYVATPQTVLAYEIAEMVIFAAACLNVRGEFTPRDWVNKHELQRSFASQLVNAAGIWLSANVPKLVYASKVESLIEDASQVPA